MHRKDKYKVIDQSKHLVEILVEAYRRSCLEGSLAIMEFMLLALIAISKFSTQTCWLQNDI